MTIKNHLSSSVELSLKFIVPLGPDSMDSNLTIVDCYRVATVREKVLENEKNSRSGKSQGITFSVREIKKK